MQVEQHHLGAFQRLARLGVRDAGRERRGTLLLRA